MAPPRETAKSSPKRSSPKETSPLTLLTSVFETIPMPSWTSAQTRPEP
jgi:hypothetical protein